MKKRVLSLLLCALMLVQFLPISLQSANAESTTVYSMATDADIQGKALGETFPGTTWLQQAGNPTLTIVDNGGVRAISVTNRGTNDWYSIDLKNLATLPDGFDYTVKVTGRTVTGTKMKLSQPGSPYGTHVSQVVGDDGAFSLEKTFTYATLQTDKSIRIQSETSTVDFTIDSIVITQTAVSGGGTTPPGPTPGDGKSINDIAITFNDADKALWSGAFKVSNTSNAAIEWVSDSGNGDTYSLKGTHLSTSTNYTGADNAIRLTFDEPLAKNAIYTISYSVYVPAAGNESKKTLVGPGVVLSGDYAGSTGVTKFPSAPGNIATGTWKDVNVTTPTGGLNETLKSIDFRFVTNDKDAHADVWYIDNIRISQKLITVEPVPPADYKNYPALKDVYKDYFMIGTASGNSRMTGDKLDIIKYQFNAFTPENEMKPSSVQNVKGTFNYGPLDDQFGKLKDTGISLIGHTLAWHSQTPTWMWGATTPLSKEEAIANMDTHIENVLGRYGASLYSMDVVNEAMADGRKNADWRLNLRDNEGWYLALGPEWVEHAFLKAAEIVDANGWNCKLYYNDYNLDYADKAKSVYNMVKDINERYAGVRKNGKPLIEGIGMQGHYNQNTSAANVENSVNLFSSLPGVAISVTELDITYQNSGSLTDQQAMDQAVKYAQLFNIYKKNAAGLANGGKGRIERVTFWGTNDGDSWRASGLPLLFDKNLRAKEAFKAVLDPSKYIGAELPSAGLTYTATANGAANTTNSNSIALVFEKPVPGLAAADIALTAGTASAAKGTLTAVEGSNDTQYNLAISGITIEGNVKLKITKDGVDDAEKTVDVHRISITFSVANVGGTAFVRDSTGIRLTFNAAVSNLSADDIVLSAGTPAAVSNYAASTAGKGALTKVSDTVYDLALTGITRTGTLGVQINKLGIETNKKNVLVNAKVDKTALQAAPPRSYFPQNITNLPKSAGLPDLFTFLDPTAGTNGRVETKADWSARRDELKDLIQYYYYGRLYPTPKDAIKVNTQTNQVNVTINDNGRTVTGSLGSVTVPSGTAPEGGWPVIIAFGFGQTAMATQNGYAVISVSNWGGSRTGNYYNLYPFNPYEYDFNTGSIMTAAWTVSRIIDAMEISAQANGGMNQWKINPYKSITTGVSINGKYALMAAAMDDRVGAAAPVDCGQSGASSFRYVAEGKLFYYDSPLDRIYRRNQKGLNSIQYSGESFWMGLGTAAGFHLQTDMDYLPFDAHAVEALVAPRPLIAFTADNNFDWTTPPSSIMAMSAAKEVYDFLGSDNIAVRTRDGAHAIQDRDVPFMIAIMDKEFSGKPLEVRDLYPKSNPPSYGTGTYSKISDMTIYPYDIDSSYIRWSRPGKYTLWTENEIVTEGIPATIKVHSDAKQVKLTILDKDNKPTDATWTANVVGGIAVFNLTAEQVKIGRYEITTVGTAKDGKTVYFQGVDVATALRHGTARNDNGAAVMYGFTSKINKDLVEVYADGTRLTSSFQEDTEQAWILNYGVTTNPNENNRILNNAFNVATLKKLQMEAMPGYTFEISIDKSKLANNQETVSWNASEAVQKIGPQPNWSPYPNSLTDNGTRPLIPATTTNFNADIAYSLNDLADLTAGDKLVITFSAPMYKGDFGIGFDFSDDFTLAWAEDGKSVEVTFNNVTKAKGEVCNIYIMRLRDAAGNMIAAPIHHSFIRMPIPVSTPTASVKKLTGETNELTITVTDVYTASVKKTYTETFTINNNAAGTYRVGQYKVYVDTKGNTQVRECYIVK